MEKFLSPAVLWKDFIDEPEEPEISVVCDEAHTRAFYFSALRLDNAAVRCFVTVKRPHGDDILPAAILLCPERRRNDLEKLILSEKCVVVHIDYEGAAAGKERFTIYPAAFLYAEMPGYFGKNRADLFKVKSSTKETPWYVWTAIVRRAIALVKTTEKIDPDKIALIGAGAGANIGWKVIGTSKNVAVAALIEPIGVERSGLADKSSVYGTLTDDEGFMLSLSTAAYIPTVACPVLAHAGTNAANNMFDRMSQNLRRLNKSVPLLFSVSPRADGELDFSQARNIKNWLSIMNTGEPKLRKRPRLNVLVCEGRLFASVKAEDADAVKNAVVYYAYAAPVPSMRNWYETEARLDSGVFVAELDLYYSGKTVYCFAVVNYRDGFSQASFITAQIPDATVVPAEIPPQRMLYDARTMGRDCFTAETGEGLQISRQPVVIEKCLSGIPGITAPQGSLVTYKVGDARFSPPAPDSELVLQLYSETERETEITLTEYINGERGKSYTKPVKILKLTEWQKVVCAYGDFKSASKAPLVSWDNVAKLSIKTDGILVGSILWV